MDRERLPTISSIALPARFDIDFTIPGLSVRRLVHRAIEIEGAVTR